MTWLEKTYVTWKGLDDLDSSLKIFEMCSLTVWWHERSSIVSKAEKMINRWIEKVLDVLQRLRWLEKT